MVDTLDISGRTIRRELDFQTRVRVLASTLIPIGNVGDEKKTKPRKTFRVDDNRNTGYNEGITYH